MFFVEDASFEVKEAICLPSKAWQVLLAAKLLPGHSPCLFFFFLLFGSPKRRVVFGCQTKAISFFVFIYNPPKNRESLPLIGLLA